MVKTRARFALRPKIISLAVASCFAAGTALANPTGHHVVRGTADIHRVGNLLQITNSPNAIINWQNFSIGANEITRFIQQSNSSAVLNRVTSQNPSQILGALQSRLTGGTITGGKVFLINPNGILFGAGSKVDVGGLVASSLNLSNTDFVAKRMRFAETPGAKPVINEGSIKTGTGGSVYLVGPEVTNSGIITTPKGEVVLAAGKSVELVDPGTPNLRVEIVAADNQATNLGQIVSDAGRVGIYAGLINNSGTIRADSAVSEGGRIMLKATKSVTLDDSSVLSAQGKGGGRIEVLGGDEVKVAGVLDASAPSGGNGGFIETSGKEFSIDPSAVVTTAAPFGKTGTWLIDPVDFTIAPTGTPGDITGTALSGLLTASNIEINTLDGLVPPQGFPGTPGLGGIFVNDTVTWNNANSLTLVAQGNVVVNQPITNTGTGDINLYAGWNGIAAGLPSMGGTPVVQCCGQIGLNAPISTGGDVKLVAGFFITQTSAGVITADRLTAVAPQISLFEDFNGARNMVNVLAGRASDGSFLFSNGKALTIDTVGGISGVTAAQNNGSTSVQIVVNGGDLTVRENVSAIAGTSVEGPGSASVTLATRGSGSILVQNGAIVSAVAGDGAFGGGGNAAVELNTAALTGGSITVAGGSRIEAIGGNAGSSGSGGDAQVTFISDGAITVDNSTIKATGGRGNGVEAQGGRADISLNANNGPLVVSNQSTLTALGGAGGSSGGGTAIVSLSGNGINVSSSTLTATGGAGASNSGGSASVFLQGGAAVVAVAGSTIKAIAGTGNQSGFGSVGMQTSSDMTVSGSTISVDGSEGNINLQANNVSMTNSSLSASSDDTGCCADTGIGVTAASSVSMTGTSTISANADGAEGGFIGISASAGGIMLGRLVTDAQGDINVSASGGSIADGNGAANNLQTPTASLTASTGIGTMANPLETVVGRITLLGGSGPIEVMNTGNLIVDSLSTSGSAAIGATGMIRTGLSGMLAGGGLMLTANGIQVGQSLSSSGGDVTLNAQLGDLNIVAGGGEGITVAGTNIFLMGANVNVGSASALTSTSVVAGDLLSVATPGSVMVTGGNVSAANALMRGGVDVDMNIGGTLQLNGNPTAGSTARVEAGAPSTIKLAFPSISADGFSVNGILNAIEDNESGFFVMGVPAILSENMFVTYGGPPPFTDILTATMNQQVDVLADQLKAGDTGDGGEDKDKKKLPFCDG